jgi:hypothetical protein
MPFYRRVRGVRASIPSGSVIGRKSGGTGAAEVISPGDIVRAGSTAAPSAIPGPAGTGVGSNGQVWGTQGGTAQWTLLSALTALGTIATGVWQATKIALAYGGTNADLSGTGGAHKFLRQNSVGAAVDVVQPDFSDLASTLGAHLLAGTGISLSGTTDVTITASGGTGTVTHTVGGLTLHAPVVGNGSADIKTLAAMTDGQLMIGSTGNDPALTTLTAGTNITITNAPGSITIAASGGGTGTVTSVAATVPTGLAVSGSPITTSGTLGFTWSGLIPLAQGGTHVDLTGTGPGYLKQASAGASVTVSATIPYSDITGGPSTTAGADWDAYVQGAFGVGAFGSGGFGSLNLENANNGQLQIGQPGQIWRHNGAGAVPNWENGGQILGTGTNDNASAGNIGEYTVSNQTSVSIANSTVANMTSIVLTAGDWDVTGAIAYRGSGFVMSEAYCCVSTTTLDVSQNDMEAAPWCNFSTSTANVRRIDAHAAAATCEGSDWHDDHCVPRFFLHIPNWHSDRLW